jgi:ATP-dependent Clp protease ATP-binding subunit ClpC
MFERFTDRARRVVVQAQEEARLLDHNSIGTEHLLLGLLSEGGGVAAVALTSLGISLESARLRVIAIVGRGQSPPEGKIPFTPRAKTVLELSLRVALEFGHNYIGTEHVLLGLVREGEGLGVRVLANHAVKPELLRDRVIQILNDPAVSGPGTVGAEAGAPSESISTTAVGEQPARREDDRGSRDLTQAARQGRLDRVVGRDRDLDRILQILTRRTRNNPVLVGESGVGKTAIVHAFAQRIADGTVPDVFQDRPLYVVDLRAEAGSRLREILAEARRHERDLLLFVEDLEQVFGARTPAATLILQMVGDNEARLISTSSTEGFRRVVGGDQRLLSVLQDVTVGAPDAAAALEMMKEARDRFEAHHRVAITDSALVEAVRLGERYVHDRRLPASAIDLIDEAGARMRIRRATAPSDLRDLSDRIARLRRDKESALDAQEYDRAGQLRESEQELGRQRARREEEWKAGDLDVVAEVAGAEVREIVEQMLKERIDNESAAPTVPDRQGAADLVFPADDVWMMA